MAVTKQKKSAMLDSYRKVLNGTSGIVVTEYRGMRMKNFNLTRKAMRDVKAKYVVAKSTLFKIALKEHGMAVPEAMLKGPIAVAIAYGELSTMTKAVLQRAKEDELMVLKGAIMGTTVFKAEQLEAVSTMPTLDQARSSLIGTLQGPATQFMGLIAQPGQGLAQILKAYSDKLSETGAA